jgi:hypothetical protein
MASTMGSIIAVATMVVTRIAQMATVNIMMRLTESIIMTAVTTAATMVVILIALMDTVSIMASITARVTMEMERSLTSSITAPITMARTTIRGTIVRTVSLASIVRVRGIDLALMAKETTGDVEAILIPSLAGQDAIADAIIVMVRNVTMIMVVCAT